LLLLRRRGAEWLFGHTAEERKESLMERVTGIGGVFFRAKDPEALNAWYAEQLGASGGPNTKEVWQQDAGPTVWSAFDAETNYFGRREQAWMVNFRVRDLDAMLAQLRAAGAQVDDSIEEYDYGRFGWATDPEGNRFELWEPKPA
jgi:predicted enzyme related to lactoylglutathione lyase